MWAPLQNEDNGRYYLGFDEKLRIVEVIIGAKCKVPRSEIEKALGLVGERGQGRSGPRRLDRFEMLEDDGKS